MPSWQYICTHEVTIATTILWGEENITNNKKLENDDQYLLSSNIVNASTRIDAEEYSIQSHEKI